MDLKPYLQLRDRLSQVWINKYTILLVLMAIRLAIFAKSLESSLNTAKYYTLSSCPTIDNVASTAVSLPHYLSKSANYMILKGIGEINDKTVDTLDVILTGAESIIIFTLEMVVGTYACVLVAAVDGAVDVAVNATESLISWVNDTVVDIADEIEDGLGDLSNIINDVIDAAEKVADLFDDDDDDADTTFSKVNLTVSALKDLHIPSSINSKLEALKENTPDFDTVKNKTEGLIKEPFDYVKTLIANTTLISDDEDGMYVPNVQNVAICSDNTDKIEEFYNDLAEVCHKTMIVLLVLMVVASLLVMAPVVWEEIRRWKRMKNLDSQLNSQAQMLQQSDPIQVYEETFNRYPTKLGVMASRLSTSSPTQTSIRWFSSYILSPRAFIVLGLSLAAFIMVAFQFIILSMLEKAISSTDSPFDDMTSNLTSKISESITNWTDSTNDYLEQKEDDVNDELFSWVRTATDSVNDTIAAFVEEMNDAIAYAFNGTILYDPVKAIVGCVIEDKLLKIEEGLTWVYDNAEITFPRVQEEYLSKAFESDSSINSTNSTTMSYDRSSFVSSVNDMMEDAEDMMTSVLKLTIKEYKGSLYFELWIAMALFIVWLLQFVIGGVMAWWNLRLHSVPSVPPYDDEKVEISYPRALTRDERRTYGYPYSDPFKTPYTPNPIENPFGDDNALRSPMNEMAWRSEETVSSPQQRLAVRQSSFYSTIRDDSSKDDDDIYSVMPKPVQRQSHVRNPFLSDSDDDTI